MTQREISCEETKKHVHEFLQEELSEDELAAITDHIANCDHCEWEYDFEYTINNVVKMSCTEDSADEIAARIVEKIRSMDLNDIKHEDQ